MRRHFLRKKEAKELLHELESIGLLKELSSGIERVERGDEEVYLLEGRPLCFRKEGRLFPSLHYADAFRLKKVVVDMGAVRHLINGADVMAPGIVEMDEVKKGELVLVVDQKYRKPLVIGYSLVEGKKPEKGKVVKNVHRLGDKIWKMGV